MTQRATASVFDRGFGRDLLESSRRTVRHLAIVACCCAVVGFAFAVTITALTAGRERRALAEIAQLSANAVAAAVDREILTVEALLGDLAASPAAQSGDFATLGRQIASTHLTARSRLAVLGSPPMQETGFSLGAGSITAAAPPQGPSRGPRALARISFGETAIDTPAEYPELLVAVPFFRQDDVSYSVALTMSARCLIATVRKELPAAPHRIQLFDRAGALIAQQGPGGSRGSGEATPDRYWMEIAASSAVAGALESISSGEPVAVAFSRSKVSGLTAVTEIRAASERWPMGTPWTAGVLGGAVAMSFGLFAAYGLRRHAELGLRRLDAVFGRVEAERRDSDLRYHAYWDHTNEASFIVDVTEDGRFLFAGLNPTHEHLTGLKTEHIFGREPAEVLPPEIAAAVTERYRSCVDAGGPLRYEETLTLPAGRRVWETSLVPVRDDTGRIVCLYGSGRDITEHKRIEDDLRLGVRRLQLAQEAAGFVALEWDLAANEGHWFPSTHPLLRWARARTGRGLLKYWMRLVHPDDRRAVQAQLRENLTTDRPFTLECRIISSGNVRWILAHGKVLHDHAGRPCHAIGMVLDITDQKDATKRLRESEARFRMVVDAVPELLITVSSTGQCSYANQNFSDFTGMSREAVGGAGWISALHPDDRSRVLDRMARAARTGDTFEEECRLRDADGCPRWFVVRWRLVSETAGGRLAPALFGSFSDVNELKNANDSLRNLTAALLVAQDAERRRIARELHDSTAQNLVGAALSIDQAMRAPCTLASPAQDAMRESRRLIELAQREIRTLSYLLHPPMLEEAGLSVAIQWYVEGFSRRTGITAVVRIPPVLRGRRFASAVEISLYRVAQEALTNAHRHAGAGMVTIRLAMERTGKRAGPAIVLTVTDDGQGFSTSHASSFAPALGVGLASMRERMEHLGGHLDISSGPTGTCVRATALLAQESTAEHSEQRQVG